MGVKEDLARQTMSAGRSGHGDAVHAIGIFPEIRLHSGMRSSGGEIVRDTSIFCANSQNSGHIRASPGRRANRNAKGKCINVD